MRFDLNHLSQPFAALRVLDPRRVAALASSIASEGQRSPVLLAQDGALVDGYHRVRALQALARDQVEALQVDAPDGDALLLSWTLQASRPRSALEEAWFVEELIRSHGETVSTLSLRLSRPKSWVSQRLGLVKVLPSEVQKAVQTARIPPQAATRYLVPMARIDPEGCQRMVAALPTRTSVRQMEILYQSWRKASSEIRPRIEQNPELFLRTTEESEEPLRDALEGVVRACHLARKRASRFARANSEGAWEQAQAAFSALQKEMSHALA
jgi:ParB/RepB/Spo0J family partition protein